MTIRFIQNLLLSAFLPLLFFSLSPRLEAEDTQIYQVQGIVKEIKPDGRTAVIKHEEIPGFMEAMTMPLRVKDKKELEGLAPGDQIRFRMVITETEGYIEGLKRTGEAFPQEISPASNPSASESAGLLKIGAMLPPGLELTDESGKKVRLEQILGRPFAFTFIFTHCPFPEYCPKVNRIFAETQEILKKRATAPTGWHLYSISFDPLRDTPQALKIYADDQGADPERWNFLTVTGAEAEKSVREFGARFGLTVNTEANGTNLAHNLRTVVVNCCGRIDKIATDTAFTPESLADNLEAAWCPCNGGKGKCCCH